MKYWLFKTEPDCYSYTDLERDGATDWDGVANPLALKYLRQCKPGDRAYFYQTGKDKAIIGILEVTGEAQPDPEDAKGKMVTLSVKQVGRLKRPVTLAEIKADERFASWELVTQSRLSVMPCSAQLWKAIEAMSKK